MAGNYWCLKNMLKEDTLENIKIVKPKIALPAILIK